MPTEDIGREVKNAQALFADLEKNPSVTGGLPLLSESDRACQKVGAVGFELLPNIALVLFYGVFSQIEGKSYQQF
jgi:hypothetical protein